MKKFRFPLIAILFSISQISTAQVTLDANGPGNTTNDINNVLAPGFDAVEEVCNHTAFGDHIDEVYDNTLGINVFRFFMHVSPDNNKCVTSDRQRNEIKTYDASPDNLKGIIGETVEYKWKFKLDAGFQASPDFTHIHQLKSVGAITAEEKQPLITLTPRYGASNDKLQLRYAESTSQTTIAQVDLTPFKGEWVQVVENVTYGEIGTGSYSIIITRLSDNMELLNYSNPNMRTWKTGASFMRPKWGIYRKNSQASFLRDEEVLFANFSIEEISTLSTNEVEKETTLGVINNPIKNTLQITQLSNKVNRIIIYGIDGRQITNKTVTNKDQESIDVSNLSNGTYVVSLEGDTGKQSKLFVVSK